MLPITHHKSFHIPHSLAMVAAAVALIAALGWHAGQDNTSSATFTPDAASTIGTPAATPGDLDRGDCPPHARCPDSPGNADLFPLVLPQLFGH